MDLSEVVSFVHYSNVRVFIGSSKSSLAALSIICLECMHSMRLHVLLTIAFAGL